MPKHDPMNPTANLLGDEETRIRQERTKRADRGKLTEADKAWLRENHLTEWERKGRKIYETKAGNSDAGS